MNPWDPILHAVPGGDVPVAPPIRVQLWDDDLEALWWAHLLAALTGLRLVYRRLGDEGQGYRTGKIQEKALEAVKRLYHGMAYGIHRSASRGAGERIHTWDWQKDPLALEVGWWAQAAYCAHALSAGYALSSGMKDGRALLAADVLRAIRERVVCALPEGIALELLTLAVSTPWAVPSEALSNNPKAGTTPEPDAARINLENS